MNKALYLSFNDFKLIWRDTTLRSLFVFPLLLIALGYWGVPALLEALPEARPYLPQIVQFLCIQNAVLIGFVMAFVLIDERDERVSTVLRIMPLASGRFLAYRLIFVFSFSAFFVLLFLYGSALSPLPFWQNALIAGQYGLLACLITVTLATIADNKVQGLAIFKGLNLVLQAPLISFFVSGWLGNIFALIPSFFVYWSYVEMVQGGAFWLYQGLGWLFLLGALAVGLHFFQRKMLRTG